MRQRGERLERPFAHLYETGALRRVHLRGHPNILKRVLVHTGGFNLGLLMRRLTGVGTPRSLRHDAVEIDQRTRYRRRATWVPVELPGLGGGADKRTLRAHIEPNWLLIYRTEGDELHLIRTGSHSDLLKE